MNFSEKIIRVFEHKSIDKIIWQPRIAYWFDNYCRQANKDNYDQFRKYVPERYIGLDTLEVYDDLNASIRYPPETLKIPIFVVAKDKEIEMKHKSTKMEDGSTYTEITTPVGMVSQTQKNGYTHDHMVKKVEDLKVVKYMVEHSYVEFNKLGYELVKDIMEPDYGLATAYFFRSPYMRCVLEFLGFEKTIIFLRKYKKEMEDFFQFLGDWDRKQYQKVLCPSPLKWINFGENIDQNLSPPHYFKKYLLEYYHDRNKMLKNSGKYTFIHIDGSFKDLLPILPEIPQDGIEALTPPPQGDVSVQEIADTFKDSDKILLDVLPATLFMNEFEEHKLKEKTKEVLDLLCPNLILGISDELCIGDGRRLKIVSDIIENYDPR